MIYRPFGKTGEYVSAIGMGGMRFKEESYREHPYTDAVAIVQRALEKGITYFDTAPNYCNEMSESIYGEAFSQVKRNTFQVSTKCGLWNATDSDGARRMIDQSLERLKLDYIDFYNLWNILTLDTYTTFMKPGGVYEGVVKAKEEGLVKHLCFTTHLPGDQIPQIINEGIFEGFTLGYNAINFAYRQEGIDAGAAAGMGIVTMNPLSGGIIPSHPEFFSFLKNGDESIVVSALRFILAQRKATVALVGFSHPDEVDEAVKATENLGEVSDSYLEEMSSNLKDEMNSLCTGCRYCDSCPEEIPIPALMDSFNLHLLGDTEKGDTEKTVLNRMKMHWGVKQEEAAKCIACGKCEKLCTQHLPIIDRLNMISGFTPPQRKQS